jgi:hypothetical protein
MDSRNTAAGRENVMIRAICLALTGMCLVTTARASSYLSLDIGGTQISPDHDYQAILTNDGPEPKGNWPNIDWIHFGDNGGNSVTATNVKVSGTGQIGRTVTPLGGLTTIVGRTDVFTSAIWSDGTPTTNQPGTRTGIETGDFVPGQANGNLNKGFSLTIGPLTQDRAYSLVLYAALQDAAARLTASLSDGTTQTLSRNLPNATLDIKYYVGFLAQSPNETLTLTLIDTSNGSSNLGSLTVEAVSLAGNVAPEPTFMSSALVLCAAGGFGRRRRRQRVRTREP